MSLEAAVYARLAEELEIPVYPLSLPPAAALPACTYQRVSTAPEYTHDGDARLERIRWQFDAWAKTYGAACELAEALRLAWSGYQGEASEDPEIYVSAAFIIGRRDLYEPEPKCYRASLDVSMWVRTVEAE
jgi:hypothetical protein